MSETTPGSRDFSSSSEEVRNLKLLVEYDGTDFSGWQRQRERRTVQGCLDDALSTITGESIRTRGASRTDAGVHAAGQVANVFLTSRIPELGLLRAVNGLLPRDVAVTAIDAVSPDFDARRSARGKVYRYRVWNHPVRSPLEERQTWHLRAPLDIEGMSLAAESLVGEHDFRAFRSSDCDRRTTVRSIRRLEVEKRGALVEIEVEATAFLRNMVRIVAGTLVSVGRRKLSLDVIPHLLASGDRTAGGPTAPPQGLTLIRVLY